MQMNTQQKRYALSRSSAIKATFFSLVLFYFLEDISKPIFSTAMNEEAGETTSNHLVMRDVNFPKKIDSGWDESGIALYKDRVKSLAKEGVIDTTVYPPGPTDTKGGLLEERVNAFAVSNSETRFWSNLSNGGWERQTFHIFNKYINVGRTTVVDFGELRLSYYSVPALYSDDIVIHIRWTISSAYLRNLDWTYAALSWTICTPCFWYRGRSGRLCNS